MRSAKHIGAVIVPDDFIEKQAGRLAGTMKAIRYEMVEAIQQAREDGARWMLENADSMPDPSDVREVAP